MFFRRTIKKIYRLVMPSHSLRQETMDLLMTAVKKFKIEGDYVEFGVASGKSFIAAVKTARKYRLRMKFYGLDSFEGLPELHGIDKTSTTYHKGRHSYSLEEVKENLRRADTPLDDVTFIKGWFNQIDRLPTRKIALAWVDCNLYESARDALRLLTPHVQDGMVLYFDDWMSFKGNQNSGEQRAFREWLKTNPHVTASEYRTHGFWGKSFILSM